MTSEPSADVILATVESYAKLASDHGKRDLLIKDKTCIQFLAYVLEGQSPEVALTALKVLSLLSEKPQDKSSLSKVYGVIEALEFLVKNVKEESIAAIAREVLDGLNRAHQFDLSANKSGNNRSDQSAPLRDSFQANRCTNAGITSNRTQSLFKPGLGASKSIILHIQGLVTKDDRKRCEEILIKIGGVVSLTFNMNKKHCILRAKSGLSPEILIDAISQTKTMTARHLVKTENGQEIFAKSIVTDLDKENMMENMPEYLSENDSSPVKDDTGRNVAILGSDIRQTTNSWLSSAANFINKSFYW